MQTMQAIAIRTSKRTTRLKYVSVILIISCFFTLPVFAQGTEGDTLSGIKDILQSFISIMSRWRIVLAALAGKMMSNDRVFGAALHMDVYLRKIWNMMKNFANFALIAFLLGSLIKSLVSKENLKIKELITKTLIAGVLIQASRFMMGALVDVSTVAVTAIGSFPVSFMQSNSDFKTRMNNEAALIRKTNIIVDGHSKDKHVSVNNAGNDDVPNPMSESDIVDSLMPDGNSLWWPLIFLWGSVFRFYDYMTVDSQNTTEVTVINFSLKTVVLLMYTVALLLLLIANIIRVAFLWIFIIASPFIVLFKVFNKEESVAKQGKLAKYLSAAWLMDLVFKPVIFMAMMSLILILVVSVQNIMIGKSTIELNGVTMSAPANGTTATLAVQWVSSVTLNDNLFKTMWEGSKSAFADLILFFLTIFLMRELIKFSLTSGEWPIQNVMKPITKFTQDFLKSTPLFGLPSVTAIEKWFNSSREKIAKESGMRTDGSFYKWEEALQKKVNQLVGIPDPRTQDEFDALIKIAKVGSDPSGTTFFSESRKAADNRDWWLNFSNGRRPALQKWLEMNGSALKETNGRWATGNDYMDIDKFLWKDNPDSAHEKNRKMIHNLMNWTTGEAAPTYEKLISSHYGGHNDKSTE